MRYTWQETVKNEINHFNILELTVKRIYWLQIPKHYDRNKKMRNEYWKNELSGIPTISPNNTYKKIACNKSFSLKVRSVAHQLINLELHFGPQCLHMHTIKHLAYCQRCYPKNKCNCYECKLTKHDCTCSCHQTNINLNNPHHILFCPKLDDFWTYIVTFAEHSSIVFPIQPHLLKWCLISSDLDTQSKQPQNLLWYQIYSIYAPLIKYTHYFPCPPESMLKQFKTNFTHSLKVANLNLLRSIDKIKAMIIEDNDKKDRINKEITSFCKIWTHPNICILNEDNTIEIQPWPALEQDPWAKYTYSSRKQMFNTFSTETHHYHTKHH